MPTMLDIMHGIQGLQMGQDDFRQEMGYEFGALNYRLDWTQHQVERFSSYQPEFETTPYHPPPSWGSPEAVYPAPRYDRDAALEEMQRQHQTGSSYQAQDPEQNQDQDPLPWFML